MYKVWLKSGSVYQNKNWPIVDLFFQCNFDLVRLITYSQVRGKELILVDLRKKEVKGGDKHINGISDEFQALAA